ncbi:MAG TPA: hypothetical protein VKA21_08085 [Candidatus Binatia bacterium]|nr:hypothetical protein [Candidatus Binatia bacterium]
MIPKTNGLIALALVLTLHMAIASYAAHFAHDLFQGVRAGIVVAAKTPAR